MNSTQIEALGLSKNGRSGAEILTRTFVFYVAGTFVAAHLTTLRRQPRKVASYQLLAFLLIPVFTLAEL